MLGCAIFATSDGIGEEQFKRISGPQIRAKCFGMEMTEEVHCRDAYQRDGSCKSNRVGRTRIGKWLVEKDELCVDVGPGPTAAAFQTSSERTVLYE